MSINNVKSHGNISTPEWSDDFSASFDLKTGKWTATISYTIDMAKAKTSIPKENASCIEEGFEFLKFNSCTISNDGGGIAKITCTYIGVENDSAELSADEALNDTDWNVTLRIALEKIPVPSMPSLSLLRESATALEQAKLSLVEMYSRGDIRYSGTEDGQDIYMDCSTSGEGNTYWITATSDSSTPEGKIKAALDLMRSGFETVDMPRIVISCTKENLTKGIQNESKMVGKIYEQGPTKAKDVPQLPADHYWILQGINQDKYIVGEEEYYKLEMEFWSMFIPPNSKSLFEKE